AVDKSEKFLAKFGAGLDENICRFFQAVVEQAVGFRIGTEVGFEGPRPKPPRSPRANTAAPAREEELFIGDSIVLTIGIRHTGVDAVSQHGIAIDYSVLSEVESEPKVFIVL